MKIQMIPLNKLIPSPANTRKTGARLSIDELAASIAAHGLLQNLQVREGKGGKFEVVAGGRRLAALQLLAKGKTIPKSAEIPCRVLEDEDAAEISLAENVMRLPMHPADQYDAFKAMADAGRGPEEIAARFGCGPTVVKQRLRLASVSPRLLAAYRAEELTLDQLMAFTVSDDHAAQEAAWLELPEWNRNPGAIRRILTAAHADANEPRAVFVGLAAYVQAGGMVLRDLFDAEHQGYLTDIVLLDRLVAEKLEGEAATLRAEGWKWVEIMPEIDHARLRGMGSVDPEPLPIDEEREEERDRLGAEYDALAEEHGEDPPEEIAAQLESLSAKIDELAAGQLRWQPADMARAGVAIGIDPAGRLTTVRGLVRPGDEPEMERDASEERADTASAHATPRLLSDRLVEDLTAQRTLALRAVLAGDADIALTATVHALALPLFYGHSDPESCLAIRLDSPALQGSAEGIAETPAGKMLTECASVWRECLPEEAGAFWTWLLEQSTATRLDLLAYCAGSAVDAVKKPHERADAGRLGHADRLALALRLDMTQWWRPTAATYLARVSKTRILEAVTEAVSVSAAENLATMKKDALVAEAEQRLSGKSWLPPILRCPGPAAPPASIAPPTAA
jgi:ParB family chromosome partitioning protein